MSYYKKKEKIKKEKPKKDMDSFDPYLNKKARKYEITCFVCKKKKYVAFEPFENIPVICDDCMIDIEARRLLDKGGIRKAKKLKCKWCGKDFYALNETYLFCDTCYDEFSHEIKARKKGLEKYECDYCGEVFWLQPKIAREKKEKEQPLLCRHCLEREKKLKQKEKSKKRIEEAKKRFKKDNNA